MWGVMVYVLWLAVVVCDSGCGSNGVEVLVVMVMRECNTGSNCGRVVGGGDGWVVVVLVVMKRW